MKLNIITMNIHKGFSSFERNFVLHQLKEAFDKVSSDLIFLQEVQGENQRRAHRLPNWPETSQYEFLADRIWRDYAYAKNAVYPHGHHGNAILSKFPILNSQHVSLSVNRWEQRGLLHCEIILPPTQQRLHAICVHLNLLHKDRKHQYQLLSEYISSSIAETEALILAGDFNDWSNKAQQSFPREHQFVEAFEAVDGSPAKSFPSFFPILRLDRIYIRGLKARSVEVLKGKPWRALSDHAALWAELELERPSKRE